MPSAGVNTIPQAYQQAEALCEILCSYTTFDERKGLSFQDAKEKLGSNFCDDEYNSYLLAYDNVTRLNNK